MLSSLEWAEVLCGNFRRSSYFFWLLILITKEVTGLGQALPSLPRQLMKTAWNERLVEVRAANKTSFVVASKAHFPKIAGRFMGVTKTM